MKIVFSPLENKANKYHELYVRAIRENNIEAFSKNDYLLGRCRNVKYFHFNWYEKANTFGKYLVKLSLLNFLRIRHKKIIYTLHNKKVHNYNNDKHTRYSNALMKFIISISYRVVIHSYESKTYLIENFGEEVSSKVFYIPHLNYVNVYGNVIENKTDDQKLNLLFFGLIKEYKNVDLLIDVVSLFDKKDISLVIAGKVNKNYQEILEKKLIGKDNITIHFGFVKNEEIPLLFSECDLSIMPYDLTSSLNSGSVILSFSYKKSVICSQIGTLSDMEKDYYFSYTFKNEEEHKEALKNIIQKAIDMKKNDPAVFDMWGQSVYDEVVEKNSYDIVKKRIKELYE